MPVPLLPLQVRDGAMVTVESGSAADVAQSVALLVASRPGERRSVPEYGLDGSLFALAGVREDQVRDVVEEWEPRAEVTDVDIAVDPATGAEVVTVWTEPIALDEED